MVLIPIFTHTINKPHEVATPHGACLQVYPQTKYGRRMVLVAQEAGLSYLTAGFYIIQSGGNAQRTIEIDGGEYHSLTLDAHHFAWSEVGNEEHILTHELFGLIKGGYSAKDGAFRTRAVINDELQEFLAFLHLLATNDVPHANIELFEIIERYFFLHGLCLVIGLSLIHI